MIDIKTSGAETYAKLKEILEKLQGYIGSLPARLYH